jgi:hypothetical protein
MITSKKTISKLSLDICLFLVLDAGYLDIHGIKNLDEVIRYNHCLSGSQFQQRIFFAVDHYYDPRSLGSTEIMGWIIDNRIPLSKMNFSPITSWSGGAMIDKNLMKLTTISPNLITCNLDQNMHLTDNSIGSLLDNCSALQELSIKYLTINGSGLTTRNTQLQNLRKIDLRGCLFLSDDNLIIFSTRIPNVTEIAFADSQRVTDMTFIALATSCFTLEVLHVERMIHITDDSITLVSQNNPNLRKITLDALYNMSEKMTCISILQTCHLLQVYILRTLDALFEIEDTIVIQLVDNCPKLKQLHMYSNHVDSISYITEESIRAISNTLVNLVSLRLDVDPNTILPDDLHITDLSRTPSDPLECLVKQCANLELVDIRRKGSGLGDWYYIVLVN